jgi:predicted Zn-dependent protease
MNRRQALSLGCRACCAALLPASSWGQAQEPGELALPQRFVRPDLATDEGGLWAMVDREEKVLRRSALVLRDEKIRNYVQGIVCRLAGEHCPDIRVYLVRTPHFNASMAPNGMMQVWSGLLLRVESEAQLAAVLGHEIGHFLQRHSLARLRDIKDKAAAGQVLALFGLVGAIGQIAVAASAYGYARDHEREADRIGAQLMHRASYAVDDAGKVWDGLLQEVRARDDGQSTEASPLFATHPPSEERRDTLARLAETLAGGERRTAAYAEHVLPYLDEWCADEVKRAQYSESVALFSRLIGAGAHRSLMSCYRGEAYRLRGRPGDLELASADYRTAADAAQPKAFRGLGLIARQRQQPAEAIAAFRRYVDLAPAAPDAPLIQSYISELSS